MSLESQHAQDGSGIPAITSFCEKCAALELVPLLLKKGRYTRDPKEDRSHYVTVKDILNRPGCDLCQYVLRTMQSMAAKAKSFAGLPPLTAVEDARITFRVRADLRNDVLPCRTLEISLDRCMGKSLFCELLPACPDVGVLRGAGSTIARIPTDVIDPRIVSEWIQTCQERHGKACRPSTKRNFDFDLWAIDVVDVKLSKLPPGADYLALSYVWGQAPAFPTTKGNLETRSSLGGLQHVIEISSRVVRDTVKLTSGMGMRYVWIDQLCVVREDSDLLTQTLKSMGDIYHHATATIVAADGSDANAGLSGVQAGSRDLQQHLVFLGSGRDRFALIKNPRTVYLDDSTYLKRAWTYQEYFFSTRRILFRDGTANFKCPAAHWQEELDTRHLGWPTGLKHGIDTTSVMGSVTWGLERFDADNVSSTKKLGGDPHVRIIEFMVHEFTERELTRDGDILDAFAGVAAYLSRRTGSPLRLGLSETHMFGCLIWKLRGEYGRERPSFASKRRPGFPTWSWASRYGQVHCSGNFYEVCFDNGSNVCNVDNWALAYVWMDIYLADAAGCFQRLNCRETQDRRIDVARLLRGDSVEPVPGFLVGAPEEEHDVRQLRPLQENTMFFRTFSLTRSVRGEGRYRAFWACGTPRSIWDNQDREIGCVYVDDIDYAAHEGEAELLLISLVERTRAPWEGRGRSDHYAFGARARPVTRDQGEHDELMEKIKQRRVGYFNVMWVTDDECSPGSKKRIGSGVILAEFLIGQVEEEVKHGMIDVFLF